MVREVKEAVVDKFGPLGPDFADSLVFGHSLAHSGAVLSVSGSQVDCEFFGGLATQPLLLKSTS